jgi:hypothetical protein
MSPTNGVVVCRILPRSRGRVCGGGLISCLKFMLHYAAKRLFFYLGLYVMQYKRLFFLLPHLSEKTRNGSHTLQGHSVAPTFF